MVLSYTVLGGHIISHVHIAVFAEMWNTQGKSLKAQVIYISSAKQKPRPIHSTRKHNK